MHKLPNDFTTRNDALAAVQLLFELSLTISDNITMIHHLITYDNYEQIKATCAIYQAKLTKIHTHIGVLIATHELSEHEVRGIEADVWGYDPTLG